MPGDETGTVSFRGGGDDDETLRCASCRELYPHSALDRQLWCPPCRDHREILVRRTGHLTAVLTTIPFAIWIVLEGSTEVLTLPAWLLPLAAAYYLGYRIGRELARGWIRLKRTRG